MEASKAGQPETDHDEPLSYLCLRCGKPIKPTSDPPLKYRAWRWWHFVGPAAFRYCSGTSNPAINVEFAADAAQKLGLADDTFLYIDPTKE